MKLERIFKKKFFVLVFFEIIALLGLKSPFGAVSIYGESSFIFLDIKKIKIENFSIYVHIYPLKSIFLFDSISINGTRPFQPRIFLSAQSSFFLRPRRIRGKYLNTYGECAESI